MAFREPLYKYDVAILKDYGGIKSKITIHRCLRTKGLDVENESIKRSRGVNDKKLKNNISRAKSKVFEYAYCNEWDYFITLTIDPLKYDRTNLQLYYKEFSQWLRNYCKRNKVKIDYLFIPELHNDKKSWHLHGFIKGLPFSHLSYNDNGYLDWLAYRNKFGYVSIDKIKDREKCASYITKYISKDLSDCVSTLNAKMYYCSKGLKKATEIKRGIMSANIIPDFENEYVKVVWFDNNTDLNLLSNLIK